MHDVETIEAIFARDGVLAQALPGYEVRAEQVAFAQGLADALDAGEHFLGEAGTGTSWRITISPSPASSFPGPPGPC